jgi:hypothetical protein
MVRHPLAREVAIVVAIKTAIVIAAAIFVFGPKQRPVIDAAAVEALIALPPATIPDARSSVDE